MCKLSQSAVRASPTEAPTTVPDLGIRGFAEHPTDRVSEGVREYPSDA